MERADCLNAVREIVVELLAVDPSQVTEQATLVDDLNADSLDIVELVMSLEERFGVEVPDDSLERMKTVGDVVDFFLA